MRNYILTIDYSYLCYKSLYTIADLKTDDKFLDNDNDKCLLMKKILKDIHYVVEKVLEMVSKNSLKQVVLACDSKTNFRKRILPESYKQDRKKHRDENVTINFDEYFKIINSIADVLNDNSDVITVLKHSEFEADDLIYGVSNENFYNLIYASDSDLEQTLSDTTYMFKTYKNTKTIYLNENVNVENNFESNNKNILEEFNTFTKKNENFFETFFENKDIDIIVENKNDNIFENCKTLDYKIEKINVLELVLSKIICGDASDSIQSVFYNIDEGYIKKKCRKQFIKKILNKYLNINENKKYFSIKEKLEVDLFFNYFVEHLFSEKYIDIVNKNETVEKLNENFNLNYDLIVFNDDTYKKYCHITPNEFINELNIKDFLYNKYIEEYETDNIFRTIAKYYNIDDETIYKYLQKDSENVVNIEFKI